MTTKHESRAVRGARQASIGPRPFHGSILDLGMADRTQVELFAAVGSTKGPFHGVIDWPYLNSEVQEQSRCLLASEGEEAWKSAGGVYGDDGKPTFTVQSSYAARIVQEIANDPGGFIWTDAQGTGWAVRLVSLNRDQDSLNAGLAISWNGGGRLIDPLVREQYRRAVEQEIAELSPGSEAEARNRLVQLAERMWLYERGEQILWAIHAAVLMQRRSIVLLPDVGLGEIVWSGKRDAWPDNWRGALTDVLGSLSQLHLAVLQIADTEWRPQFTMRSAAVAYFEDLERNRKRKGFCRPGCPLWNRSESHNHFLIQIGYGFLGLLEKFAVHDAQGMRQFDFTQKKPRGEQSGVLIAARKRGEIVPVHLPTKVFGPSGWSQFTRGHRGIIQGLVREVTRVQKKGETTRRDRADVRVGSRVPDVRGQREIACPLLQTSGRYVGFNGNGLRRGLGYLIVGRKKDRGWLFRCGYHRAEDGKGQWTGRDGIGHLTRQFLSELNEVAGLLGLTVVGLVRTTGGWLTLAQVQEIAALSNGLKNLDPIHLRVYGPENYLERCRHILAERGGFSAIPGTDEPQTQMDADALLTDVGVDLRVRLQGAGLSQDDLAKHLGKSKAFISQLLSDKKQWPAGMRERAEAFIASVIPFAAPEESSSTDIEQTGQTSGRQQRGEVGRRATKNG